MVVAVFEVNAVLGGFRLHHLNVQERVDVYLPVALVAQQFEVVFLHAVFREPSPRQNVVKFHALDFHRLVAVWAATVVALVDAVFYLAHLLLGMVFLV